MSCNDANIWVRCEAIKRGIHLSGFETWAGNVQVESSWQVWLWLVLHHGGVIQSCLVAGRICSNLLSLMLCQSPLTSPLSLHLEWMKSGTTSLVFGFQSLWSPSLAHTQTHSWTTACPLCLSFNCTTTSLQEQTYRNQSRQFFYDLFDFCLSGNAVICQAFSLCM